VAPEISQRILSLTNALTHYRSERVIRCWQVAVTPFHSFTEWEWHRGWRAGLNGGTRKL